MLRKLMVVASFSFPLIALAEIRPGDPALDGLAIEERQDQMQSGYKGETRFMTMILINAQGQESVRKLLFAGREDMNRREKTVVHFDFPPDVKGTALLTHEHGEQDDDQWLYLPSLKRVKRIASSNQSGSFMGSEFAYEDLVVRQIEKYTFRYLGDEVIDGQDCYVIERTPKNRNSGYSKVVRWRMKSNLQELRTDYYDRKGELLKQRFMTGHRLIDGFWRVSKMTVKNVQTNKASVLTFDDVKLKLDLPEHKFTVQEFGTT